MSRYTYEVCVFTIDDAIAAERGGARRIELNSDRAAGGCTPSAGAVRMAKKLLKLDVAVMIRPRTGGFVYSDNDFAVMLEDVDIAVASGADAIVTGMLTPDSGLDAARLSQLVKRAGDVPVAYHLAYERIAPEKKDDALEELISIGVRRLLTGGRPRTYDEAVRYLSRMQERAAGRIELMPCEMEAVPYSLLPRYMRETGAEQIHLWDVMSKYAVGTYPHTYDHVDLLEMVDEEKVRSRIELLERGDRL